MPHRSRQRPPPLPVEIVMPVPIPPIQKPSIPLASLTKYRNPSTSSMNGVDAFLVDEVDSADKLRAEWEESEDVTEESGEDAGSFDIDDDEDEEVDADDEDESQAHVLGKPVEDDKTKPKAKPIDWEIPRKTLHASIGFPTLILYSYNIPLGPLKSALWGGLAFVVGCDFIRLRNPSFERYYESKVGSLMRDVEKKKINGVVWYLIGVLTVLYLYPLDIAAISILILSWADTTASTIGRLYGPYTPPLPARTPILRLPLAPRKSLAGFGAAFVTAFSITWGFWKFMPMHMEGWRPTSGLALFGVSVGAGIVGSVAEALDLGSLDDNLTLPIISGGCIWGLVSLISFIAGR